MPVHSLITLDQIQCYQVLDGNFRAYVRGAAEIQAWGINKERAIAKLGLELARREIPFDITEEGRVPSET